MLADKIRVFEDDKENEAFATEARELAARCEVESINFDVAQEFDEVIFAVTIEGKGQRVRAAKPFGLFKFSRSTALEHFHQVLALWRKKIFIHEQEKVTGKKLAIG